MQVFKCSFAQNPTKQWMQIFTVGLLLAAITACGFQLRGAANLPFKTLYIQGKKLTISRELAQNFKTNGIQVLDSATGAELILELVNERNEKRILSLSGGGLVREFELLYTAEFRTRGTDNPIFGPVQSVQLRRDFSYNDNALLGKAEEEERLNNDMRKDAAREILRRLSALDVKKQVQE